MFHEGTCACVYERCAKSKFYLCMRRASPTRYERSQCRAFTAPAMSPGPASGQSISPCSGLLMQYTGVAMPRVARLGRVFGVAAA